MRIQALTLFLSALAISSSVSALDAACEAVLKAGESRINQPAWHSITELGVGMRVEVLKADGQFYRQMDGKWVKFPANVDALERQLIAQMRSGEAKLSQCKILGSETLDGVAVTVISSRTELKGAPPADAKLYIGKSDGLPYQQLGKDFKAVYRYKNIAAPKL